MPYHPRINTDYIIVHGTWTRALQNPSIEDITNWHTNTNGWPGVAYHFYIDRNARIFVGSSLELATYHTKGFNDNSLSVALAGGRPENKVSTDWENNYSKSQMTALYNLIKLLKHPILYPTAMVISHSQADRKRGCPGFDANEWYKQTQYERENKSYPTNQ